MAWIYLRLCDGGARLCLVRGGQCFQRPDIAVLAVTKLSRASKRRYQSCGRSARRVHEARFARRRAEPAQVRSPIASNYAAGRPSRDQACCGARHAWYVLMRRDYRVTHVTRATENTDCRRSSDSTNSSMRCAMRISPCNAAIRIREARNFKQRAPLVARPKVDIGREDYARLALGPNADPMHVATYIWFHLRYLASRSG